MTPQLRGGTVVLVLALTGISGLVRAEGSLTPAEERGRQIYLTGESTSGDEILAHFGEERIELPSNSMICGGCHGPDGTGRPESGIVPPDIRWPQLTRSYGHRHAEGGHHAAFESESLGRYLRTGIYPGGLPGEPSMPTYRISDRDLADLLAYLVRLGEDLGPGIEETSIRIGTIVPSTGSLSEAGVSLRRLLIARLREVNAEGGVHGRRIELIVHESSADPGSAARRARAWLEKTAPFALLSPFALGLDGELQSLAAELGIPVVGPVTLFPLEAYTANRHLFYILPGLSDQMEALVHFAAERIDEDGPEVVLLHSTRTTSETVAAIERILGRQEWRDVESVPFGPAPSDGAATLSAWRDEEVDVVLFLGSEAELESLLAELEHWPAPPVVLAAGVLAGRAPFSSRTGARVYLSYPTLPQDREEWAMADMARLLEGEPTGHFPVLANGYAATSLLIEGLRRAGRELRREKIESVFESLFRFETGLTPPLTFTRNRRVGARGAYVVSPGSSADSPGSIEVFSWVDLGSDGG